jgi:ATP-dependent protease HslVU (ClpYQ) peptidase subunit
MTAIAGIAHNGAVWIGGDSAGAAGHSVTVRLDRKVFRNGTMLFGFTHSFRTCQLFQYALTVPDHDPRIDTHRWLCTAFVDAARQCLKDGGYAATESGVETGTVCLIGYQGNLYSLQSDWQVGQSADNYDAVGCGSDIALGALHATTGTPVKRITAALEAAAHHSGWVAPPFIIERT